jgi:hypothetical protein
MHEVENDTCRFEDGEVLDYIVMDGRQPKGSFIRMKKDRHSNHWVAKCLETHLKSYTSSSVVRGWVWTNPASS